MRDTGTTTSSLILPGASVRSAGDKRLARRPQPVARGLVGGIVQRHQAFAPGSAHQGLDVVAAAGRRSPSASIISSAPARRQVGAADIARQPHRSGRP